jgi:dolichyl-phosphate-mannose--protein O-mannosyl transferase
MIENLNRPRTISSSIIKVVITVTREITFRILVGTFMGGLMVAEAGIAVVEVAVIN